MSKRKNKKNKKEKRFLFSIIQKNAAGNMAEFFFQKVDFIL